ncbi:hypothetical protein RND81_02G022000 [Saponaria officinalis]
MFRGDDASPMFLSPIDGGWVPYNCNAVSPMQCNVLAGSNGSTMNTVLKNNASLVTTPMKLSTVAPIFSQHKLPVTLNDRVVQDEGRKPRNVWKQIPVSTGLKLSYGEDDHNSSISSAGENALVNLSSVLSHHNDLHMEFVQQSDELDQYIRVQEENMRKGIAELTYRHTMSLLSTLEKEVNCRMREKNAEIEALNNKNKELVDKIRRLAVEAQTWHYRAKQNESLVNSLRTNINQIFIQRAAKVEEGYDENILDDAISSCNHNHAGPNVQLPSSMSTRESVICKGCKTKEVCVLLLPCRHLCLCTDCEGFIEVCPVCRVKKAGSLQVYMS